MSLRAESYARSKDEDGGVPHHLLGPLSDSAGNFVKASDFFDPD